MGVLDALRAKQRVRSVLEVLFEAPPLETDNGFVVGHGSVHCYFAFLNIGDVCVMQITAPLVSNLSLDNYVERFRLLEYINDINRAKPLKVFLSDDGTTVLASANEDVTHMQEASIACFVSWFVGCADQIDEPIANAFGGVTSRELLHQVAARSLMVHWDEVDA